MALVGRKKTVVRHQLSLRKIPVHAFYSRAQGFSPPPARQRSSCPPPSPNLVRTHPKEHYQAIRDSAPSLPLACRHPPEGHQIGARKRRAPGNTLLSQLYRRRVSTDRLNREGSQLAASLEGEPGPTPAGKTRPHCGGEKREAHKSWSMVIPEKAAPIVAGTTLTTTVLTPAPADSRQ